MRPGIVRTAAAATIMLVFLTAATRASDSIAASDQTVSEVLRRIDRLEQHIHPTERALPGPTIITRIERLEREVDTVKKAGEPADSDLTRTIRDMRQSIAALDRRITRISLRMDRVEQAQRTGGFTGDSARLERELRVVSRELNSLRGAMRRLESSR